MALVHDDDARSRATAVDVLGPADLDEALELYAVAYPTSWFDARRLETGRYVGRRVDGRLVAVAGVHVHAPALGVAVVGDVATHPSASRTRAGGSRVRGALPCCSERTAARRSRSTCVRTTPRRRAAYERIGFRVAPRYLESTFERLARSWLTREASDARSGGPGAGRRSPRAPRPAAPARRGSRAR